MSINRYHESHHTTEPWYQGKKNAHAVDMSEAGQTFLGGTEYELEFAWNADIESISTELQNAMNGRLKCERDGSLNHGFECISYPATFGCHKSCYGWKAFFETLNRYNPQISESNGQHIHVSRASLGNTEQAIDLCIAKLVYMFDNHSRLFSKIAGRSYRTNHYCRANNAGIETTDKSDVAVYKVKTKASTEWDRYRAINLTNEKTVEFRVFAVDYNYNHFMARMEFVHWLVTYCKTNTFTTIYNAHDTDIKNAINSADAEKYGELQALLAEIANA